ncbi:hypothetical protein ATANTOWER_014768 [Ataeniobius toweri]|uniref:Uncharacterized protein n=1 Tax=Ataeniobius toweri TaxID=208326 RepID=A0ABU7AZD9_9TELE|nr:hypothetical protein [Ataeniobius toweri]
MSQKNRKTKNGYLRPCGTVTAQLGAQEGADWPFVHSGEVQNCCSGPLQHDRWPALFITWKVTLSAFNRATIGETPHFRAAVEQTREREPGGSVRPGTGRCRAA